MTLKMQKEIFIYVDTSLYDDVLTLCGNYLFLISFILLHNLTRYAPKKFQQMENK